MAASISLRPRCNSLSPQTPLSSSFPSVISLIPHHRRYPLRFLFSRCSIRATSSLAVEQIEDTSPLTTDSVQVDKLACPVCYEPLRRKGPQGLNLEAIYRSGFKCGRCNKTYSSKNIYLDLTVTSGSQEYTESQPSRTELFRSPLVSFLYERGWRQNFNRSGFPGVEEEFRMAQEYFKPAEGGLLVDVSCGSGLFSRKFAKSGLYSGVIALDFSENMLRQCYDFLKKEETTLSENLALVRADVSRLPFPSASVDAVHAGAALHCWSSPSNAIAEITRILRSGGVFVGTTFLRYTSSTPAVLRPFREGYNKPAWLDALYSEKFFVNCSLHETSKKNEKNVLCLDCCISICPHCLSMHRFHRLIQIRRYVYHDVIRLEDLEKLIDCSNVQAYTINSAKVIFIKKRPQNRQFKWAGNYCTSCDRSLQEPYIHCSLGCKVDYVLKHYKDLSPYLRVCNTLQLSPDFLYPQDLMMDDVGDYDMPTMVDCDEPMAMSSSTSSGSTDDMTTMMTTMSLPSVVYNPAADNIVRKKRSTSVYVWGRSSSSTANNYMMNKATVSNHHHHHHVSDEDMASNMINRRKGIPHRSPLC